nr:hypothetical protein [Paraburkholderia sacchari]
MDDLRMGMICATLANCFRDPKKHRDPFQPIDFMPWAKKQDAGERPAFEDPADQAQYDALALFGIDLNRLKALGKRRYVAKRGKRGNNDAME